MTSKDFKKDKFLKTSTYKDRKLFHDTFKQSFQSHQNPPHNLQKLLLVIWVTPDKKLTRSNEKKGDIVTPKKQRMMIYSVDLSLLTIIYVVTCVLLKMEKWKKGKYTPKLMTSLSCIVSWWNVRFRYSKKAQKFCKTSSFT